MVNSFLATIGKAIRSVNPEEVRGMADRAVHIGLMALTTGGGAKLFLDMCFNYPTLGDLYMIDTACDDELVVICAPNHRLGKSCGVTPQEVLAESIISRESGSGTREFADNYFHLI